MAPVYNTPEGRAHVQAILKRCRPIPIIPHDYQLEGICVSLDGEDLMATTATGTGKTGFFSFLMLVILAIAEDPSLSLGGLTYPKNPAMLLILPTKALQVDMHKGLLKLGLDALVINQDTYAEAREKGDNLWIECQKKYSIILLSPEELQTPGFRLLLDSKDFIKRVCRFGIDEVHLLYAWGVKFRPAFSQIGFVRSRLPTIGQKFLPLVATTATLREGKPMDMIRKTLGLQPGHYHLLRRSNLRSDIKIIFREMTSSLTSHSFPELDWILHEGRNTVIFCKYISLGFRVVCYLWRRGISEGIPDISHKIRLFNSLNSVSYNKDTLGFLDTNMDCSSTSVTVATDTLSVGWDSQTTCDAVILGEPQDIDEFVQKIGRVGRNRELVTDPRAFFFHTRGALSIAEQVKKDSEQVAGQRSAPQEELTSPKDDVMDISIARLLLADCKLREINEQYGNTNNDPPCGCANCLGTPRPSPPSHCMCSGVNCQPEPPLPKGIRKKGPKKKRVRRGEGISKNMHEYASEEFIKLRSQFFVDADPIAHSFLSPYVFLPDPLVKTITEHIYSIKELGDLVKLVEGNSRLTLEHHQTLFENCQRIHAKFEEIRQVEKSERAARKGAKGPGAKLIGQEEAEESDSDMETFMVIDDEKDDGNVIEFHDIYQSKIKWRINVQNNTLTIA